MTSTECADHIGRRVVYTPFKGCHASQLEVGVITSVNGAGNCFVRYGADQHSKCTRPGDLHLEHLTPSSEERR